jgi:hypothetical protein
MDQFPAASLFIPCWANREHGPELKKWGFFSTFARA